MYFFGKKYPADWVIQYESILHYFWTVIKWSHKMKLPQKFKTNNNSKNSKIDRYK